MWMVVFGAGASHDCVPELKWKGRVDADSRLPLTTELFEPRKVFTAAASQYDACASLLSDLWFVAHRGESIEEYLQDLVNREPGEPRLAQQLMAFRFYLREVIYKTGAAWSAEIGPVTNYAALLQSVRAASTPQEPVILVTFNYDSLLETARWVVFRDRYGDLDQYVSGNSLLFKPHGSISWSRLVKRNPETSLEDLIEHADSYDMTPQVVNAGSVQQRAQIPAIAIPTLGKSDFECPPEHIQLLTQFLPRVSSVVTIGWRAQEDRFLSLWAENAAPSIRGIVVSGSEEGARETSNRLNGRLPGAAFAADTRDSGFSDFIRIGRVALDPLR